jgi:tetratricopeptide (TPR) repeat protein
MTGSRRFGWHQRVMVLAGTLAFCTAAQARGGALPASPEPAATTAQVTAGPTGEVIATLEASRGQVTIIRLGRSQEPSHSMPLQRDDIVVTKRGRASVRFRSDGTVLRIGPDSRVQINESATERDVTVFFGRLWAHVVRWRERTSRFASSSTIAAIRGTEAILDVAVDGDETQVAVLEGHVETETDAGSLTLEGGQVAVGRKGTAPAVSVRVRPLDAVQWALYYLPVLYPRSGELGEGQPWQAPVRESIEAYRKGDLGQAVESLENVAVEGIRDPRFFTYRASLRLATGSVEDADQDIEQALKLDANNSDAFALRAIVAVANNRTREAMTAADRAVTTDPRSSTAQIARSYAQQALFNLEAARESLEKAVQLDPDDALAWARLAEIRSSLGHLGGSLEAAQKAADLEPSLSRTQTVLGFAYLTRVQIRQAIALDEDDPLPRLGLGLAKIRGGNLTEGNADLEVAVSLDPGDAVVRAYLGKGYFEEKRTGLDEREYDVAKDLDPNDPTAWLYDAIAKQTTNRPIEALKDNQKAIELNDNRAVYRSRLLLDSDEAARSASLGRIYSDLGYQDRALVEGWNSVNIDPTSFSAHRFLADSYAALPRHEVARVSELLQSQLLQPLNMTPIQPRLGESNLFLISAGGPASLSFNEFNPLFNRNGVNFLGTGLVGDDGLWSGEGTVAGIYKKLSFSAGYDQYSTDGWRENAFQKDKIGNAFVQLELSPNTSIQAEYRYRDLRNGDIQQRFFADNYSPGTKEELKRNTYRLGGRHSFSPGSVLLVSATAQDADGHSLDNEFAGPGTFFESTNTENDYGVEVEHLFRSRRLDVSSGVGYFNIDGESRTRLALPGGPPSGPPDGPPSGPPDGPPDGPPSGPPSGPPEIVVEESPPISNKYHHVNAYVYASVKPITKVIVTVGGSVDSLKGDVTGGDLNQFNPKAGVIFNPVPGTTIRAAAFRTLKRTLVTDQTLEPTQVGGFNQFFDDSFVTDGWRYGGGIDQKLGREAFVGAEVSKRDLEFPFFFGPEVRTAQWDEWLGRAYLFATPHKRLALRAQYIYERFERVQDPVLDFSELKTQRVPLGVGFFHPSGLSANLTVTYWKQDGQFPGGPPDFAPVPGSSNFWLVDAAVSYRLPKRYGFIAAGATNLFDKDFQYYEVNFENPTIAPKRSVFVKITLAIP